MIQEIFGGRVHAGTAAAFVGLVSLFSMAGALAWSAASDRFGRRTTLSVIFALGIVLFGLIPSIGRLGSIPLFTAAFAVIFSLHGGVFGTLPAYVRDRFGTMHIGAIHGRLLTAWSVAAVLGPLLVRAVREHQIESGVPRAQAYSGTMYVMCGLLLVGLLCNLGLRALREEDHYRSAAAAR
jgi:MFS family permease